MHAAVVTSFDHAPEYTEHPTPTPRADTEIVVDVIAAGLHPRVRSQADGSHYTSTDELPLVPGIDGVGRGPDGVLRYFILPDTTLGSMAEQTLVDVRRSIVLPELSDAGAIAVAAAMNPAMSSWVALRKRIAFAPGQSVLILGATGSAGRMAIQVARHLGAGRIVAAGRGASRMDDLLALGATETVLLDEPIDTVSRNLGRTCSDIDVVLDYLWGPPTEAALTALATHRTDPGRPLSWVEIGSVAGAAATIPSAALRSVRLNLVGSGQGSLTAHEILSELPALAGAITDGTLTVDARPVALTDVTAAWADTATSTHRVVITP